MQVGDWELETVPAGLFKLDGGTMFGVVPKPLWQRFQPADALNRIDMAANCVLARDGRRTVLIDTGPGIKFAAKQQEQMGIEPGDRLLDSLAALNISPDAIDVVVLSHLHFDHAGGATRWNSHGRLVPTFPRARYVVQQGEWEVANANLPELRGSYPGENFLPLAEAGQLDLISGDVEIVPGLRAQVAPGHTRWHQCLVWHSAGKSAIYLGDLCPLVAHLRTHWCMAYDVDLLESRRTKFRLLTQAARDGWLVMWPHDPQHAAGRIVPDAARDFLAIEMFDRL